MFSLLKHSILIDKIIMFGKEILMVIFLPVIAVMTFLVVTFLRVIDGTDYLLDIAKVKSCTSPRGVWKTPTIKE